VSLRFKNLGSGSSGNATVIQARDGAQVTHLLVDCGLGIRELGKRLGAAGMLAEHVDAIFITHEHADHIGCVRQLALRERIPVYMSHGTYVSMGEPDFEGLLRVVCDGMAVSIGAMEVRPFTVPHDAREPLQLTCTDGATRMGVLTDLGRSSEHVLAQLAGCRTLLLECNHDPEMLEQGSYPWFLKRRIGGGWGHLANEAAAAIAMALRPMGLQRVVAAHLSEQNNRPDLARAALAPAMGCDASEITVADGAKGCAWTDA
jgi:phosphoribosyl 1,2-cyclic phosphodiesterase